jgi:hypothetical protein
MFFLIHIKGWIQVHMFINPISVTLLQLPTIFYSSTKYESNERTNPTKTSIAPHPSPRPCYKVLMFFLMQSPKGWIQVHMVINPIRTMNLVLLYQIYINEIRVPTKNRSPPFNTQIVLQSLFVLPNSYS